MREAHAEVIAVGRDEHLRLVPQTAEGDGMDDAVAVALKGVARPPHAPVRLVMQSPPRPGRIASIGCQQHPSCPHLPASLSTSSPAGLVHGKADMTTPPHLFTTSPAADRLSKSPMRKRLGPET